MARAVPLFSGSKGNSYYIGSATEGVLIDAGRSCKQIENAMLANGLDMGSIGAVFITHEHTAVRCVCLQSVTALRCIQVLVRSML